MLMLDRRSHRTRRRGFAAVMHGDVGATMRRGPGGVACQGGPGQDVDIPGEAAAAAELQGAAVTVSRR